MVSSLFKKYIWAVIAILFLVILAGSVVRVTQSGMGCPDWPTCFGQAIPPTQEWQVHFQPNKAYKKGQFIIQNDSLKYAVEAFTSGVAYNTADWKQYEKHNYAKFEVSQTWIEYINRLLGGLLVLAIMAQCIWCAFYWKKNPAIIWLGFCLVLLSAFQAWLGKTVVDSNLAALKITLHLAGALAMVFVEIGLLYFASGKQKILVSKPAKNLIILLGMAVLLQMVIGTQVRGQIDLIAEKAGFIDRSGWIAQLNFYFYFHRSFSLLVMAITAYLYWLLKNNVPAKKLIGYVLLCIAIEILLGILFVYAGFPVVAQPIHLLVSSILIAIIFNTWLRGQPIAK
jgi:cytochrome c oxidase assembly protein subunit 15